ncbi:TrlF family AAA-like ATPase [Myroides odoratimimus]|uniref:DNA repair protein n=1 Tax=Myroides odoratimimus TaxID=76832 RepID=A0AAI8C5M4_9FLAO|nr:ATP-binding protein [Myroides odoratimimus]ALU26594.1 hypothetical protein AS202_10730 [Myroides odoratimimus]MDM1036925.1 hypothetical protein [Myroides odoratimimus]MDM1053432.1 hypothetical protein [Myroides odoratimimus]MDM1085997.1 hypothetical protein [Myroides odoratimimus]
MSKHINKYHKGSEWRKWDLHFHAPSTYTCAKNDQYEGSDLIDKQNRFIDELKTVNDIVVLGITDYFSLEAYKLVLSRSNELPQFDLILPNIELRITPVTNDNRKINLHIIPNTEVLNIDEIERFLYKFEFGPDKLTCKREDLIQLGRKANSGYSEEEAFKKGLNEFAISYDKFFEIYNSLSDRIRENILIGVSNNSGDGASGIKDIQGIREIIYSGVHFIFSAQPNDKIYFLGNGVDNEEIIKHKYGTLKPCLHGSDYHGSKDGKTICVPDLNRFCWIKADPTFEGLKQVIYEPEDRVFIQASKPQEKTGYQIIDHIEVNNDSIFNNKIHLNQNLNSIIGGRSSGKSILLGAIATKVKTTRVIEFSDSGYQKYVKEISDTIKVIWKDGQEENNREVEYFEQGYMHKIARNASELDKIVNDILIQKGKEPILEEYKRFVTDNSKSIAGFVSDYFLLIRDIQEKESKVRDKGDKKGIEDEIAKLKEELTELSVTAIKDEEKLHYEKVKTSIEDCNQRIQSITKDVGLIDKLKSINIIKDNLDYELISLTEDVKAVISTSLETIKADAQRKWTEELERLLALEKTTNEGVNQEIEKLSKDVVYLKVLQAYKDNSQLSEYEAKIKTQTDKLFEITTLLSEITNLKQQVSEIKTKITLAHKSFYDKITNLLGNLSDSQDGLAIIGKYKFEGEQYKSILNAGLNLQGFANRDLAEYSYVDFNSFESHQFNLFDKLEANQLTLKGGYNNQSLITSLLSTNFFSLSYDIEYEGDDFKKMSDGKKAFVVLKLLLDFSDKNCPILIDQPEDDLDNRAIYNNLVQYLRNKKKLRQVIVATHNPNIVVGADSELVICANQHGEKNINNGNKKFQYVSGSLEHTFPKLSGKDEVLESQGTREHVCEVLEGGNIAFKLREKKYSIKE